jgi:hypothetical protein
MGEKGLLPFTGVTPLMVTILINPPSCSTTLKIATHAPLLIDYFRCPLTTDTPEDIGMATLPRLEL